MRNLKHLFAFTAAVVLLYSCSKDMVNPAAVTSRAGAKQTASAGLVTVSLIEPASFDGLAGSYPKPVSTMR